MSQGTLRVIARLVARAGKEEALRSLLMGLIAPTLRNQGVSRMKCSKTKRIPGSSRL